MTKIKLFHSYLFISNSKNIYEKNNKIYNENDEFICGLLNVPKNKFFTRIILEKNLIKNKQSRKTNTYFEKNNIKVFIEYNVKDINIKNICKYDSLNQFFDLISYNYVNFLDSKDLLFNVMCINKNLRREIFKNDNSSIIQTNPYVIKMYNLLFDIENKLITNDRNNINIIQNRINIDGSIIYTDNIIDTIKEIIKLILKYNTKRVLVLTDKNNKKNWYKNLDKDFIVDYVGDNEQIIDTGSNVIFSKISCIEKLKNKYNFDIVIFDNTKLNNEYFDFKNVKKIYITYNTLYNECETIENFVHKINIVFNKNLNPNKITHDNICNLSKIIVNHNFYDMYCTKGLINNYKFVNKLLFKNKQESYTNNIINQYINFEIDINTDLNKQHYCSICMEIHKFDNVVKTNCNHFYCRNCATKLLEMKYSCSICRTPITKLTKKINNFDTLLNDKKWYYVGENIKKLVSELSSINCFSYLYFEDKNLCKYVENILNISNLKCNYKLYINSIEKFNNNNKISNENLKLFYFKTKKNMYNSEKKLVMELKNNFTNVSLYQLNIY